MVMVLDVPCRYPYVRAYSELRLEADVRQSDDRRLVNRGPDIYRRDVERHLH
jgi:hypothetical protein